VAVVFKPVQLRAARRQRQHGIQTVERLNRRLFVGCEHGGVLRWIQVEPNHVSGLGLDVQVVGSHVPFEPVRLDAGTGRGGPYMVEVNLQVARQLPSAPMGTAIRWPLRFRENARLQRWCQHGRLLSLMTRPQPVEPVRHEAPPPTTDAIAVAPQRGLDRGIRRAVGQHQDYLRALGIFGPNGSAGRVSFKLRPIVDSQGQRQAAQRTSTELLRTSQ